MLLRLLFQRLRRCGLASFTHRATSGDTVQRLLDLARVKTRFWLPTRDDCRSGYVCLTAIGCWFR
jgi:hypothetical protein